MPGEIGIPWGAGSHRDVGQCLYRDHGGVVHHLAPVPLKAGG